MSELLIPVALSSEIDEHGKEHIHVAAGATSSVRPLLSLAISGNMEDGKIDVAMSGEYTVSGGIPPYSPVTVTQGSLPTGIVLADDGTWEGIPTEPGDFSWTVNVQDSRQMEVYLDDTAHIAPYIPFEVPVYGNNNSGQTLYDVAINGDNLLTASNNGRVYRSTGGEVWERVANTIGLATNLEVGNCWYDRSTDTFYIQQNLNLYKSEDQGFTWSFVRTLPHRPDSKSVCIVDGETVGGWSDKLFFIFGSSSMDITMPSGVGAPRDVIKVDDTYYVGTSNGRILKGNSLNSLSQVYYSGATTRVVSLATNGEGLIVGLQAVGNLNISTDNGETWTHVSSGGGSDIVFASGKFYMGRSNDLIYSSEDCITWTPVASQSGAGGFFLSSDGKKLLAAGITGSGGNKTAFSGI